MDSTRTAAASAFTRAASLASRRSTSAGRPCASRFWALAADCSAETPRRQRDMSKRRQILSATQNPYNHRATAGGQRGNRDHLMNHQQAVDMLKALPKHKGWTATKAVSVIDALDRDSFSSPTDYAEAVTAAMIGQRWESVHGKQGYDTASTLTRWLGKGASKYGNPEILFDAKTQRKGVGYSEKVSERASKATDYLERRKAGGVINGVVFHTRHGVFFQLGIDHESTTPQFGKRKRPIVGHEALPRLIDGNGGILPAILLSSKIQWSGGGFDGLEEVAVQEVKRNLRKILKTVL